ncbi:MAG TPA: ABC transporter permease subunit [Gammaproteobacteria bacterium]|nr:ABC transporter permease subunit [Gammaproteobacteria bacterium]
MNTTLIIAAQELRRLFKSPLAWIILAVVEFLLAIFFLLLLNQFMSPTPWLEDRGLTEIVVTGLFQVTGIVLLLVTPFITMRLFSEERRNGTIKLLFSSPVSITELVLGKYIGTVCFLLIMLFLIALMPLSLLMGSQLDMGQLAAGLFGLFLLMSSFAAIGLFISTLTSQTSIAAIITFGILFMLWIINLAATTGSETFKQIFTWLSLLNHYNNLIMGLFNSTDLIYYLIIITVFIALSVWRLDGERLYQ